MCLKIKALSLIDIELDTSFLVLGKDMGIRLRVPTFGHLILGGDAPIRAGAVRRLKWLVVGA